jgi:hypothetical protein
MNKKNTDRLDALQLALIEDDFSFEECMFGYTLKNKYYTVRVYEKRVRKSVKERTK